MRKFLPFVVVVISGLIPAFGQTSPDILKSYVDCKFADGLVMSDVKHIVKKGNKPRAVNTSDGPKEVSRIGSYRVMIKYPEHDYFMANIRPEKSLASEYEGDKPKVIDFLANIAKDDETMETPVPLKETYNGFDFLIRYRKGFRFDKYKSKKNPNGDIDTVGIGILLSNLDQTITTIYFFNTTAPRGKGIGFKSIDEWNTARKQFLTKYTQCINSNLNR